jgi:hypothetical protein
MNMALEMHDSFILGIHRTDNGLGSVMLKGVVHQFEGEFGEQAHVSGWQRIRMSFTQMTFEGEACEPGSYVSEGFLSVNGAKEDLILFPARHVGAVRLLMTVSDDFSTRSILARSLEIASEGSFEPETAWDSDGNPKKIGDEVWPAPL